jgi:hypothetical protein
MREIERKHLMMRAKQSRPKRISSKERNSSQSDRPREAHRRSKSPPVLCPGQHGNKLKDARRMNLSDMLGESCEESQHYVI